MSQQISTECRRVLATPTPFNFEDFTTLERNSIFKRTENLLAQMSSEALKLKELGNEAFKKKEHVGA